MHNKGYITREYVVWCGCSNWHRETTGDLNEITIAIRALGWRKTKKHGWRCPQCVARERVASEDR